MTRETIAGATRLGRSSSARGTVRKFYDDNLMQEVDVDTHFSETHTKIERPQPIGLTSVPLKQNEEQGSQQQQSNGEDRFNYSQPKGPAAEPFVNYIEGNHSHPVVLAMDDRRVRPYAMKEGRGATYAPDGSEQMLYFKQDGAYLVSLDGKSVEKPNGTDTRMASMRHVNKDMQTHKITEGQQQQEEYKHEGKSVNTEVRCIKDKVQIFAPGDKQVGLYDKSAKRWFFDVDAAGTCTLEMLSNKITAKVGDSKIVIEGNKITITAETIQHEPGTANLLETGANKLVEGQELFLSEKVKIKGTTLDTD